LELESQVKQIKTRQDLVQFISMLRADLEDNPAGRENLSLLDFLDSLAAWIESMDQCYRNQGVEFSEDQPWKLFAEMLLAARIYE